MITEDYVSFETAKLLKEKGFSENTVCKYADVGGVTEKWYDDYRERVLRFKWKEGYFIEPPIEPKDQYEIIGDTISAPTLQMAMKWLREVHHVYLNINVRVILGQWSGYDISIHTTDKDGFLNKKIPIVLKDNTSYEQACEAAIKYCLENLI